MSSDNSSDNKELVGPPGDIGIIDLMIGLPFTKSGKAEAYATLQHGSKITFSDGSGFELLSESGSESDDRFRRNLWLVLGLGAAGGLAAAIFLYLF